MAAPAASRAVFVGNEVGVREGVGHGHLLVVHILPPMPVIQRVSRVLRTDLIGLPLTLAESPAIFPIERPGGDHYGPNEPDLCP